MPALSFQERFVDAILSGKKRQTIRKRRKDGRDPKPGDTLYLYTGMRTKKCRKLGEAICHVSEEISLSSPRGELIASGGHGPGAWVLTVQGTKELARADGFRSAREMSDWFEKTHGLPFSGLLIRWGPLREAS